MKQSELHFRIHPLQSKDRFKEEGGRVVRYVSIIETQVRAYIRQPKLNYREEEQKERENSSNKGELSEGEEEISLKPEKSLRQSSEKGAEMK